MTNLKELDASGTCGIDNYCSRYINLEIISAYGQYRGQKYSES